MPVSVHHQNGLRTQFLQKQLMSTTANKGVELNKRQRENVKKWCTRYRRNWELFVIEILGIHLHPIQAFVIHMMGVSDIFFDEATRGAAKSFDVGIGSICEFCLKPYSEIVITSSTISQASKLVETKIRDEIIKKLSNYLLYMYEKEYITVTRSVAGDGAFIVKNSLNESKITVLPCLDSSRGSRSTLNIYEEARLLKKSIIDSVFEPMGHMRQAKFILENPKYNTKRWQEPARSIYITSAGYHYEWFSRKFRDTVTKYFTSKHERYVPFAQDIFAAIAEGSRTWADYRKNKESMSEMTFKMEILNETFTENEDAFFSIKSFKDNQTLKKNWKPPTDLDIVLGRAKKWKKEDTEIRIVVVDYAFANTTSRQANDNSIILCMSLHWRKNRFERHVDYIEGWPAGDSLGAANRAKIIFNDYQADYFVPDAQAGGESLFNLVTETLTLENRGENNFIHGLTVASEPWIHVLPEAKLGDLRQRTVDPDAIPCIVPIKGDLGLNSRMWIELKKQLEINNIKFLIDSDIKQEQLEESGEYFELTTEELVNELLPYGQTESLIKEAVELQTEIKEGGKIRLHEDKSATKDRIVCLSYGNYIASKIENKWLQALASEDVDDEDIQLVF